MSDGRTDLYKDDDGILARSGIIMRYLILKGQTTESEPNVIQREWNYYNNNNKHETKKAYIEEP